MTRTTPRNACFVRRVVTALLILLTAGNAQAATQDGSASTDEVAPPHIVLIVLDDVGCADIGCYDPTDARTPHLDTLARQGVRFDRFYACGSICTPSRFSIQTGHYPVRLGLREVYSRDTKRGIPPELPMIAEVLSDQGYRCDHVGKWHLGTHRESYLPMSRGFSSVTSVRGGDTDPTLLVRTRDAFEAQRVDTSGHLTDVLFDRAFAVLTDQQDQAVFLQLCLFTAHTPIRAPRSWEEKFPDTERGRHLALVANFDAALGRFIQRLDDAGLGEKTLVVVTSDNGPTDAVSRDSAELSGGKSKLLENGIRVPLVVRWTGRIPTGVANEQLCATIDLFPTLAAFAGISPDAVDVAGESLAPQLTNPALTVPPGRTLFWDQAGGSAAIRWPWKWLRTPQSEQDQLFNLAEDSSETTDVSGDHPALLQELATAHRTWKLEESRIALYSGAPEDELRRLDEPTFRIEPRTFARCRFTSAYDSHDGSLSIKLGVSLDEYPKTRAPLLRRRGSWSLDLARDGHVLLIVQPDDPKLEPTRLRSERPVPLDRDVSVAFTFAPDTSAHNGEGLYHLHVDGSDDVAAFRAVKSTDAPIVIGDRSKPGVPGRLGPIAVSAVALSLEELSVRAP